MSLINDMLKDLEKRPKRSSSKDDTMFHLHSTRNLPWKKHRQPYFLLALVTIIIFSFLLHAHFKRHRVSHISVTQPLGTSVQNNMAKGDIPAGKAHLTGIAMQLQQNNTFLRLMLSQNAIYRLSADMDHNALNIILENTLLTAALPKINYAGSGIENIEAYDDNAGNLKLVIKFTSSAELTRLDLNKEGKAPELQLEIYSSGESAQHSPIEAATATIPVTIKKPVMESQTEEAYNQALALSHEGKTAQAITLLTHILNQSPIFKNARKELASLLIREDKIAEAKKQIQLGLALQPNNSDLVQLAAHILVNENKLDRALKLLEQAAPPLAQNPEYHAYIAGLYQSVGKDRLAANLYKQLLMLNPSNAKWWLGLGLALEGEGDHAESAEALSKAENIGGLNPELKAYIESRLQPV